MAKKLVVQDVTVLSVTENPAKGQYPVTWSLEVREDGSKYSDTIQVGQKLPEGLQYKKVSMELIGFSVFSGLGKNGRAYAIWKADSFVMLSDGKK